MANSHWPQQNLMPLDVQVGMCAWRATMLPDHVTYIARHPSLIVFHPDDPDDLLETCAPHLAELSHLPVMLGIHEPTFARRLPEMVLRRMSLLGLTQVPILTMWVQEPRDLKSGSMLQHLFDLRRQGMVNHIGLAHQDVLSAEWIAAQTNARVLVLPYSFEHQLARYRALPAAAEYGMACIAYPQPQTDSKAIRFALGEASRILPVFDQPLPSDLAPMGQEELELVWEQYQAKQPPPPPLPRSRPPEGAD